MFDRIIEQMNGPKLIGERNSLDNQNARIHAKSGQVMGI